MDAGVLILIAVQQVVAFILAFALVSAIIAIMMWLPGILVAIPPKAWLPIFIIVLVGMVAVAGFLYCTMPP